MRFDSSRINKILVISLSNIGDVILTLPVMDILLGDFPRAKFAVVVGPKAQTLFKGNPLINDVHVFDKSQSVWKTIPWVAGLCAERFDLVVDLRNTAIPVLIFPRYRTPLMVAQHAGTHMKYKHLQRLHTVYPYDAESPKHHALTIPPSDEAHTRNLLQTARGEKQSYIIVAPGAASEAKRWTPQGFIEVCYQLIKRYQLKVVFVGDETDRGIAERMVEVLGADTLNLCGRTTLLQLAQVTQGAALALVNDSAPMHLASYLDVPVLALFGPSDVHKYGPWGLHGHYLQKNQGCPACHNPRSPGKHNCMAAITSQDVLNAFRIVQGQVIFYPPDFNRGG
ncbi:MAG: glycosyltransferase family 9 protein [Candidatus Omnitrophica bacterium]|nr:glycosyltransferase family 9 protein [Candidatus Omnitrophota bacterium]